MKTTIYKVMILCLLLAWLGTFAPTSTWAQSDFSVPNINRHPPEMLNKNALDMDVTYLEWQIRRSEAEIQRIDQQVVEIRSAIEDHESKMAKIANDSPSELSHATDAVREELISRALQKLLDARIDIAANEALIQKLSEQQKTLRPDSTEQQRFEVRANMLRQQLTLVRQKDNNLATLHDKGVVTQQDLLESRIRIEGLEGELAGLLLEKELSSKKSVAELADQLAEIHLETHLMKARAKAAELQLGQLANAAEVARRVRREQRKVEQLVERLRLRVERYEQLLADAERAKSLLIQAENARRGVEKDVNNERPRKDSAKAK